MRTFKRIVLSVVAVTAIMNAYDYSKYDYRTEIVRLKNEMMGRIIVVEDGVKDINATVTGDIAKIKEDVANLEKGLDFKLDDINTTLHLKAESIDTRIDDVNSSLIIMIREGDEQLLKMIEDSNDSILSIVEAGDTQLNKRITDVNDSIIDFTQQIIDGDEALAEIIGDVNTSTNKRIIDGDKALEQSILATVAENDQILNDKITDVNDSIIDFTQQIIDGDEALAKMIEDVNTSTDKRITDVSDSIVDFTQQIIDGDEALAKKLTEKEAELLTAIATGDTANTKELKEAKALLKKLVATGDVTIYDKLIVKIKKLKEADALLHENITLGDTANLETLNTINADLIQAIKDGDDTSKSELDAKVVLLQEAMVEADSVLSKKITDGDILNASRIEQSEADLLKVIKEGDTATKEALHGEVVDIRDDLEAKAIANKASIEAKIESTKIELRSETTVKIDNAGDILNAKIDTTKSGLEDKIDSDIQRTKSDITIDIANVENTLSTKINSTVSDAKVDLEKEIQRREDELTDKYTIADTTTNERIDTLFTATDLKIDTTKSDLIDDIEIVRAGLASDISTKVDKEYGKVLSHNDLTDTLKSMIEAKKVISTSYVPALMKIQVKYSDGTDSFIDLGSLSGDEKLTNVNLNGRSLEFTVGTRVFNVSLDGLIVNKSDIGLGSVDNTSDANKPISIATQTALGNKVDKVVGKELSSNDLTDALRAKIEAKKVRNTTFDTANNQIKVTYTDGTESTISLASLTNDSRLTNVEINNNVLTFSVDENTLTVNLSSLELNKDNVGLGNVDNTSDINKPISNNTRTALDGKVDKINGKGLSSNDLTDELKTAIETKKVTSVRLDEGYQRLIISFSNGTESGFDLNKIINNTITDSGSLDILNKRVTFKRSDNTEYTLDVALIVDMIKDHESDTDNPHNLTKIDIGLSNVDNTSDYNKPLSRATTDELDNKVDKESGKGLSTNDFTNALKNAIEDRKVKSVEMVNQNLKVTYTDGESSVVVLPEAPEPTLSNQLTSGSLDDTNRKLIAKMLDDSEIDFDLSALYLRLDGISTNDLTNDLKDLLERKKVEDTTFNTTTKEITVLYTDGTTSQINLSALFSTTDTHLDTITFDSTTKIAKFTVDGNDIILDLSSMTVSVTKEDLGLGNVDNTSDTDKPVSIATQTALDGKVDKVAGKGLSTNDLTDALKAKIEAKVVSDTTYDSTSALATISYTDGTTSTVDLGLSNVDNTSDANKPVSIAVQEKFDNLGSAGTNGTTAVLGDGYYYGDAYGTKTEVFRVEMTGYTALRVYSFHTDGSQITCVIAMENVVNWEEWHYVADGSAYVFKDDIRIERVGNTLVGYFHHTNAYAANDQIAYIQKLKSL